MFLMYGLSAIGFALIGSFVCSIMYPKGKEAAK
ncbi:hypothetical protein SAMN05216244_2196 [Sediminibacillus halophilus]|uniref:Uncharacterized protein n=1 Tax=Sediminibacillus halophilus TaxID=482461 RepID=A0A1G9RXT6_9BACI|nr:hypothetical protein SAMN05216244_2196 [Sediminibacillus halophilus]